MKYEEFIKLPILDEEQKEYLEMIKEDFGHFNYNKNTYFCSTIANFKEVENEEILNRMKKCDVDFQSYASSRYIYTEDGVYRYSDHWNSGVASCSWFLDCNEIDEYKLGFCKWNDFVPNDFRLMIYSNNKELIEKYTRPEGIDIMGNFCGRCINYYKFLEKDNFGTGIKIENKSLYSLTRNSSCSLTIYTI